MQCPSDRLTLEKALEDFLRAMEGKNRSDATIRAYRTDVLQFIIWLRQNDLTITNPARVEKIDITEYLAFLAERRVSGVSRARKVAALREYFKYCLDHEIIQKSPAATVPVPRKEKPSRTYLVPGEYNKMLSLAALNVRDFAILQVFLQTGVRVSELVALRVDDIDFAQRTLTVRAGKGMVSRTIELEKKAIQAIRNYLDRRLRTTYEELFLNRDDAPFSERGIRKLVVKYRLMAGITKKASCHSLRHTFATYKATRGVSAYQLQEWLGHARLDTTQIYVHLAKQDGRKAMEATSL
ncbi:MAG TPA: tyrosine-type recombinase/integrase [Sphingobacteriaceae bacterium]